MTNGLHQLETIILLLIGVFAFMAIARQLLIPYPIFLVLGGLALSLVPGVPVVHLEPRNFVATCHEIRDSHA